ncbi:MAG: transposase [Desulfobacterales bacterium]|nr:transposase [Desulfobacterales bacterium]
MPSRDQCVNFRPPVPVFTHMPPKAMCVKFVHLPSGSNPNFYILAPKGQVCKIIAMDPLDLIQQGKVKRYFRTTRKLTSARLVSHLTQRAAGKEPLFIEDGDYLSLLANLKEIAQKRSLSVFAFCLMSNHIHLLLRPEAGELAAAMRDLFSRYALFFNRKYERKGHLFGSPYRQAVCLDEGYLIAASLYIHNNPVKAGICQSATKYRWSSVRLYCDDQAPASFVSSELILDLIGGAEKGRDKYRRMLEKSKALDAEMVFEQPDALEGFRKALAEIFPSLFRSFRGVKNVAEADLLDPEELEQQIEAARSGKLGSRPQTRKAMQFLIAQLISRGFTKVKIAEMIGVSRKTVYNLLNQKPKH